MIIQYGKGLYGWTLFRGGIILYVGKYRIRMDRIEKI